MDHKIRRREPADPLEKLSILIQIARGLRYAHQHGVVHRDVKPSNIRVLDDGTAKIMDFGIARLANEESGLTQSGMTLGTASYLAPEQIRGEPLDQRTDIFALGILAYERRLGHPGRRARNLEPSRPREPPLPAKRR